MKGNMLNLNALLISNNGISQFVKTEYRHLSKDAQIEKIRELGTNTHDHPKKLEYPLTLTSLSCIFTVLAAGVLLWL